MGKSMPLIKKAIIAAVILAVGLFVLATMSVSDEDIREIQLTEEEDAAQTELIADIEGVSQQEAQNMVGAAFKSFVKKGSPADKYKQTERYEYISSGTSESSGTSKTIVYESCVDTDYGKTYNTSGSVKSVFTQDGQRSTKIYSDVCQADYVREYYCSEKRPALALGKCSNGCSNGACVAIPESCQKLIAAVNVGFGTSCINNNLDKIADVNNDGFVNIDDATLVTSKSDDEAFCASKLKDETVVECGIGGIVPPAITDENIVITKGDNFLLGINEIVQYTGADKITSSANPKATFKMMESGETITVPITGENYGNYVTGEISISGVTYKFANASSAATNDFNIFVDLNGNGIIGG